jgi:hypothetical protein
VWEYGGRIGTVSRDWKSKIKPRCFKNLKINNLPVIFGETIKKLGVM